MTDYDNNPKLMTFMSVARHADVSFVFIMSIADSPGMVPVFR